MRLRPILTVGFVLALATAGTSIAAPKAPPPLCKQVRDAAHDPTSLSVFHPALSAVAVPYNPNLDIVSADVANDATTITAVIRVAKLTVDDPTAPSRIYWLGYTMRSSGEGGNLHVQITPTGTSWQNGAGKGVIDTAKNEIRISVPISRLTGHPLFKPGDALTRLIAHADLTPPSVAASGFDDGISATGDLAGDQASGLKDYPVGAATCVKVGA
jgi:hypothetical protein